MTIQAGKLRRVVLFQTRGNQTVDSFRNPQDAWTTAFEDRADFQAVGSAEFHIAWKRFAETTGRFHMRFRSDVNPETMRIVMVDDRFSPAQISIWDIKPPLDPDGRQREMYIEGTDTKGTDADAGI